MKRNVSITITIDPDDYDDVEDSPEGVLAFVEACFDGYADFPQPTISCEGITRKIKWND